MQDHTITAAPTQQPMSWVPVDVDAIVDDDIITWGTRTHAYRVLGRPNPSEIHLGPPGVELPEGGPTDGGEVTVGIGFLRGGVERLVPSSAYDVDGVVDADTPVGCTSDDPTNHQGDTCPIHEAPAEAPSAAREQIRTARRQLQAQIDMLTVEVERLRDVAAQANSRANEATCRHEADIALISERLNTEATDRGWCGDYDRIVEDLNRRLHMSLTERQVTQEFTVTLTITVTGTGEDAADNVADAADDYARHIHADMDGDYAGCTVVCDDYQVDER